MKRKNARDKVTRRLNVGMTDELYRRLVRIARIGEYGSRTPDTVDCQGSECDRRQHFIRKFLEDGCERLEIWFSNMDDVQRLIRDAQDYREEGPIQGP
jgi:hypothetical protein